MPSHIVRQSLVFEALRVLRQGIHSGLYGTSLLPERKLASELGISRPTLRMALQQLEDEGLLATIGRRGRQISQSTALTPVAKGHGIVRMLQSNTPASFLNETLQTQEFLAEHLRGAGEEFHVETAPGCFTSKPAQALEHLVRTRPTSVWVLYLSTEAMQRWFQERHINCVLLGSRHQDIDYVSIDEDYRATCRHATGIFAARGHRQLAILLSDAHRPGDQASREGFEQGVASSRSANLNYCVATHDETVAGICRAADQLLARPHPPTGWLIMNAQTYLTICAHLARKKVLVGRDISLICRNSDPYFNALLPSVAHYQRNAHKMNQRLVEVILQRLRGIAPQQRQWLISSQFCDGESIVRL